MSSQFEQLPWLVLSRICELLDTDADDGTHADNQNRTDLWSFSLTSKQCCAVAAGQRFSQVRVVADNTDELVRGLERCVEMLDRDDGGRFRHVRRLKIIPSDQVEPDDYVWDKLRHAPSLGDMHRFCCPPTKGFWHGAAPSLGSAAGEDEPWLVLARFIGRFPALRDIAWGFRNMPRPILAAIHAAGGCRLHMHRFRLDSLVVELGGSLQADKVDPNDYALATSPALCSIVVQVRDFEKTGEINYNEEAVLGMLAGAAPNLQHVCAIGLQFGIRVYVRQAGPLEKPPAPLDSPLFFPSPGRVGSGSLRSLFFIAAAPGSITDWTARTDFSKLRCLSSRSDAASVNILADMAGRGELASLEGLCLQNTERGWAPDISRLIAALRPSSLRSVHLEGEITGGLVDAVLLRQGTSLRQLSWDAHHNPYHDGDDDTSRPVVLNPALAARLADTCLDLERGRFTMMRTMGDAQECAVYRELGRLPRLKHLALNLHFTTPPARMDFASPKLPRPFVRQVLENAAIDAGLARAVFDVVAGSNGPLQHLQLLPRRMVTMDSPASYDSKFHTLVRWLTRSWVCDLPIRGADCTHLEVRELAPQETADAGKVWEGLGQGIRTEWDRVYGEAFGDLWPQAMSEPRWWEHWSSMPLRPGESD